MIDERSQQAEAPRRERGQGISSARKFLSVAEIGAWCPRSRVAVSGVGATRSDGVAVRFKRAVAERVDEHVLGFVLCKTAAAQHADHVNEGRGAAHPEWRD